MCGKSTLFVSVVSVLALAAVGFPDTILYYSFDGDLGVDVPNSLPDGTGNYTGIIIDGTDPCSTVKYAAPNPTYNATGTSAEFYNEDWDTDDGDTFLIPDENGIDFNDFNAFTVETYLYADSSGSGKTRRFFAEEIYAYMYLGGDNTLHAIRKWGGGAWDENWTHLTYSNFPLDTWSHVAMTWDANATGKRFKLYVAGVLVADANGEPNSTLDSDAGFAIGGYQRDNGETAQFFQGKIDEFRLSDVALQPSEFLIAESGVATQPYPLDLATDVCPPDVYDANMSWKPGKYADKHNIYFGTSPSDVNESADPCVENYDSNSWQPPTLQLGISYYWRIEEVNDGNAWLGPVWQFTVEDGKIRDRSPEDGYRGLPVDVNFTWTASCLATHHDVYFGTDFDDVNEGVNGTFIGRQPVADTNYDPSLQTLTNYYWRVDEVRDGNVVRKGDTWSFRTQLGGVLMSYSFDGTLGNDLPGADYWDDTTRVKFQKHDDGGSVKYAQPNPTYNFTGTSALFEPNSGLYRLDPCDPNDPNPDILRLDGYQYTIEFWLYVNPGDYSVTNMMLVGKANREPWSVMLSDLGKDDDLRWYHDDDRTNAGGEMEDRLGEWTHVAAVFDHTLSSRNQKLYVNGRLVEDGGHEDLNPADNNDPLGIGVDVHRDGTFENYLDGRIDELRILDIALRPTQFLYPFADDPSPFDGQQGIDPNDPADPNVLSWTPWEPLGITVLHDVYFGTDYDSVRDANTSYDPNGVYMGRFDSTTYPNDGNALPLELSSIYYWRVDEVGDGVPHKGPVWTFRTEFAIVDPNLALWYTFDEGQGEWVYDNSGHILHCYDSSINPDNWDADGRFDYCLHFKDDVGLPVETRVLEQVTDGITVSVWLNGQPQDELRNNWVIDAGGDGNNLHVMVPDGSGNVYWRAGNDSNDALTWEVDTSLWQDEWHHFAFVKDESADKMYIYFDGEVGWWKPGGTTTSLTAIVDKPFKVGAKLDHGGDYEGKMDDLKVFDYAKSQDEIQAIYRGGDVASAWGPTPYDGQADAPRDANLAWKPGNFASSHDVYFGTDYTAARDANTAVTLGVFRGSTTDTVNDIEILDLDTTYYWRIDEVNDSNGAKWTGKVWKFKVADYIIVDDFESYDSTSQMLLSWTDATKQLIIRTGARLYLANYSVKYPAHGGDQIMRYGYYTDAAGDWADVPYAEAWLTLTGNKKNWKQGGVRALTLFFYGLPTNAATEKEQMYVGIDDENGTYAEIRYGDYERLEAEDINDLNEPEWHRWFIALPDFNDSNYAAVAADVNFADVNQLYIGFGNRRSPQAGGHGEVRFDDIRLNLPECRPDLIKPVGDFTGGPGGQPDCVVDLADFGYMADEWLKSDANLVDIMEDPCDANLLGHWKLDGDPCDSSSYDHNSTIEGSFSWVVGHANDLNPSDGAVQFTGDGGRILVGDTSELRPKHQVSVSAWVYASGRHDGTAVVVVKGQNDKETYDLDVDDDDNPIAFNIRDVNGNKHDATSEDSIPTQEWLHLAGTYDGNTIKLYMNAYVIASSTDPNIKLSQDTTGLAIGNRPEDTDYAFIGVIDEVCVYDYGLSEAEVAWLATDGTGYRPMNSQANLYDLELPGKKAVNFRDYAKLLDHWLEEQKWP